MKKTLFHIERDTTRAGRTINALLALLTANRLSFIFSFKLTIVKRNYTEESLKRRAKENLYIALVLMPLSFAVALGMERCNPNPITPTNLQNDTIQAGHEPDPRSLPSVAPSEAYPLIQPEQTP